MRTIGLAAAGLPSAAIDALGTTEGSTAGATEPAVVHLDRTRQRPRVPEPDAGEQQHDDSRQTGQLATRERVETFAEVHARDATRARAPLP
jgi:hypothetical protein